MGLGLLALGISTMGFTPLLVWNASPSSPRGFYAIVPAARLRVGNYVAAWPPVDAQAIAAARGYLPVGIPLVKTVAAAAGDAVCIRDGWVRVNGRTVGWRVAADSRGRALPRWSGCRNLRADEALLLGLGDRMSFDGRYFGPLSSDRVLGRAILVWRL